MPGRDIKVGVYFFGRGSRGRALTREDIRKTVGFIDFDAGGEMGIVQAKIFTPEFPMTDGYSIIGWENGTQEQGGSREDILHYGNFFPREDVSTRTSVVKFENSRFFMRVHDPCLIEEDGIYTLYPKTGTIFLWNTHNPDYEQFALRLKQEELALF